MKRLFLPTLFLSLFFLSACASEKVKITSPDGTISFQAILKDGVLRYSLYDGKSLLIDNSKLGFELKDAPALAANLKMERVTRSSFDQTWEQVWGEQHFVRNCYNEVRICIRETQIPRRQFDLVVRVFNDGIGFRYEFPKQEHLDRFVIMNELTEFRFTEDHNAWWIPAREPYYESIARHTPLSKMDTVNTPLTIELNNGRFAAIHEANLTDYAKMRLFPTDSLTLRCDLTPWSDGAKVYAQTPFKTPWRTLILGQKAGDLVTSRLMLNLNEPCKISDTSWIKPAKYIGIWWSMHLFQETWSQGAHHGATTQNAKRYIDFAAENNIQGVLAEGWNEGWDGEWTKNTDKINFTKCYPDFDLGAVAEYARQKRVAWIGHHETGANTKNYEAQLDAAFALYQQHGVHYVKTGYVNVLMDGKELHDSQYGVRHYRHVVETAARYNICIDNHEPVMPTGIERTWPNLMTQEGIRGQEYDAWSPDGGNPPEHTTVMPFLRGLAGPMDYTFGTFNFANPVNPQSRVQSTIARELAHYVVLYSPLQMASDLPENYREHQAFGFIHDVPTDWEQTVVPQAVIGDYTVVARQKRDSQDWFLGAITDENARTVDVSLTFLAPEQTYIAQIYADGKDADWKDNPYSFHYEEKTVHATDHLSIHMASGGGCAIRFVAQNKE